MKRYKINRGEKVNTMASKTGIKWRYAGKVDDPAEAIRNFETNIPTYQEWDNRGYSTTLGLRVTDTETGQVIYEKMIH